MSRELTIVDHERDAEIERLREDLNRLIDEVNAVIDGFGPHAVRCTGEGSPLANLAASLALSQFRAMHALERAQKTNLASVEQVQPRNQRTSAPGSTPNDGGVSVKAGATPARSPRSMDEGSGVRFPVNGAGLRPAISGSKGADGTSDRGAAESVPGASQYRALLDEVVGTPDQLRRERVNRNGSDDGKLPPSSLRACSHDAPPVVAPLSSVAVGGRGIASGADAIAAAHAKATPLHAAGSVLRTGGALSSDSAEGASAREPDEGCEALQDPSAGSPSSCPRCVDLLWRAVGPRMAAELVGLRAQITAHLESDHA